MFFDHKTRISASLFNVLSIGCLEASIFGPYLALLAF